MALVWKYLGVMAGAVSGWLSKSELVCKAGATCGPELPSGH